MKNLNYKITFSILSVLLIFFSSCGLGFSPPKPQKEKDALNNSTSQPETHFSFKINQSQHKALWFTTTDYQVGQLHRIDFKTGRIYKNILTLAGDVQIINDGENKLILLTRSNRDSLQLLKWDDEKKIVKITNEIPFEKDSNPQYAARDKWGQIFVTFLEKNFVSIYKEENNKIIKIQDIFLDELADPHDKIAELGFVSQGHFSHETSVMIILAKRLQRRLIPGSWDWVPASLGGMAIISGSKQNDFKIKTQLIEAPNPLIFFNMRDDSLNESKVNFSPLIVASGDQSSQKSLTPEILTMKFDSNLERESEEFLDELLSDNLIVFDKNSHNFDASTSILDSAITDQIKGEILNLVWNQKDKTTCLMKFPLDSNIFCLPSEFGPVLERLQITSIKKVDSLLPLSPLIFLAKREKNEGQLVILNEKFETLTTYSTGLPIQNLQLDF
jgi:hypothetical protein